MFGVWKRKSSTPDVVIYTKPDCPLCDKAKALLEELSKEFPLNLIEKDVNSEEKARKYYADRVPVILVNGREVGVILPGLLLAVDVLFDEIEGELLAQLFEKGLGLVAKRAVGLGVDHHIGCGGFALPDSKHSGILRRSSPSVKRREAARD